MAGGSLLALLDDISTVLDDVAVLSKVAAKKTAGLAGDDLAVNAEQVRGVRPARELPVVWAVARGSLVNKAILVPAALALSVFLPWAVTPLLMLGGLFLCYEGAEKVVHKLTHRGREVQGERRQELQQALRDPAVDLREVERDKVRGAIRTDFILSAEIIAIALGTVAAEPFLTRALVLCVIGVAMTVIVYGFVAAIVKFDDVGVLLADREGERWSAGLARATGRGILRTAPWLMRALSVAGTMAMFLVGGGILVHGVEVLAESSVRLAELTTILGLEDGHGPLPPVVLNLLAGVVAGLVVLGLLTAIGRLSGNQRRESSDDTADPPG